MSNDGEEEGKENKKKRRQLTTLGSIGAALLILFLILFLAMHSPQASDIPTLANNSLSSTTTSTSPNRTHSNSNADSQFSSSSSTTSSLSSTPQNKSCPSGENYDNDLSSCTQQQMQSITPEFPLGALMSIVIPLFSFLAYTMCIRRKTARAK